jgi:hypothetical protein
MNGGRLFRRPKLSLSCSAEGKEGREGGRKEGVIQEIRKKKSNQGEKKGGKKIREHKHNAYNS